MTWFLVVMIWGLQGYTAESPPISVIRFPMTSATACNDAQTGMKFPTAAAQSGWNYAAGMVAFCMAGDQQTITGLTP